MYIRCRHRKELFYLYVSIIILVIGLIILLLNKNRERDLAFYVLIIPDIICLISCLNMLGYEEETFYITEMGIYKKWAGLITCYFDWKEIQYVGIEYVAYIGRVNQIYDYIICSTVQIKNRYDLLKYDNHNIKAIKFEWLCHRPRKVVAIHLDDFKEGQLEEFWSYVPERLKK